MFAVQGCSIAAAPPTPPYTHAPAACQCKPGPVRGRGREIFAVWLQTPRHDFVKAVAAGRGTVPCRPASLSTSGCLGQTVIILADGSLKKKCPLFKKKIIDTKRDKSSSLFLKIDRPWNIFNLSWSWAVKHSQLLNDVLLNFDIDYSVFVCNSH